jgi:hypothetical protein
MPDSSKDGFQVFLRQTPTAQLPVERLEAIAAYFLAEGVATSINDYAGLWRGIAATSDQDHPLIQAAKNLVNSDPITPEIIQNTAKIFEAYAPIFRKAVRNTEGKTPLFDSARQVDTFIDIANREFGQKRAK